VTKKEVMNIVLCTVHSKTILCADDGIIATNDGIIATNDGINTTNDDTRRRGRQKIPLLGRDNVSAGFDEQVS